MGGGKEGREGAWKRREEASLKSVGESQINKTSRDDNEGGDNEFPGDTKAPFLHFHFFFFYFFLPPFLFPLHTTFTGISLSVPPGPLPATLPCNEMFLFFDRLLMRKYILAFT